MTQIIPLHSLAFCNAEHLNVFPVHECLSKLKIENDLVGAHRDELSSVIFNELRHRISVKLSIGERVIVFSDDLSKDEKHQLGLVAHGQGSPVIEIDDDPVPVKVVATERLQDRWAGITVIGDVHGDHSNFVEALSWARSRNHFVWLLGDIIDYGERTLDTMTAAYHAVMHGEAAMIIGNHEKKIARWLDQKENGKVYLRMSEGNKVTINALEKLNTSDRRAWIGQFRSLLAHSSLMVRMNDITFVHAAVHPSLWSGKQEYSSVEKFALYGEADQTNGKFKRTYRWVDHIPMNQTVFVGHDVLHAYPMVKTGAKGGQVVFLDTGCGKGGKLSSADLRFSEAGLRLECFKRY